MEVDEDTKENLDLSNLKETNYEDKLKICNAISSPMAPKKLTKKIYKLIKKGKEQIISRLFDILNQLDVSLIKTLLKFVFLFYK